MCNVLRKPQKEQLCQNFNVSTGQEALEAAVVLELSESSLCLNGTVTAKQLSFFGGNILVRLLAHLLKFPADGDLFSPVLIFCLAADRPLQTRNRRTQGYRAGTNLAAWVCPVRPEAAFR